MSVTAATFPLYNAPMAQLDGVKTFTATKGRDRIGLGEQVTAWVADHPDCVVVDKTVTQSSDSEFHCLTITLFYRHAA